RARRPAAAGTRSGPAGSSAAGRPAEPRPGRRSPARGSWEWSLFPPAREAHGGLPGTASAPIPDTLALTLEQRDPQGKTQDPRGKATVREAPAVPSVTAHAPCVMLAAASSACRRRLGRRPYRHRQDSAGAAHRAAGRRRGFMPQQTRVRRLTSRLTAGQRRTPLLAGLAAAALAVPGPAVPGLAVPRLALPRLGVAAPA